MLLLFVMGWSICIGGICRPSGGVPLPCARRRMLMVLVLRHGGMAGRRMRASCGPRMAMLLVMVRMWLLGCIIMAMVVAWLLGWLRMGIVASIAVGAVNAGPRLLHVRLLLRLQVVPRAGAAPRHHLDYVGGGGNMAVIMLPCPLCLLRVRCLALPF